MSPSKRKPPWPSEARAQGGQSFDGSSATIGDQDSKASTESRACGGCACVIGNHNLGGNSGKSALSGPLWCATCLERLDRERLARHEFFKAAQLKVEESARAEVEAILAEFRALDGLLEKSRAVLTRLRCDPGIVGVQRELVLLSREYARDVAVMIHGFQQKHWYC